MKISELVAELQKRQKDSGDVPVFIIIEDGTLVKPSIDETSYYGGEDYGYRDNPHDEDVEWDKCLVFY